MVRMQELVLVIEREGSWVEAVDHPAVFIMEIQSFDSGGSL